jgi:transposase
MGKRNMFVGMDVHKESIDISVAEEGRRGEMRHYGVIGGDLEALGKVVRALRAPDRRLHLCTKRARAALGSTAT